jgi:hypothetical protein
MYIVTICCSGPEKRFTLDILAFCARETLVLTVIGLMLILSTLLSGGYSAFVISSAVYKNAEKGYDMSQKFIVCVPSITASST